VNIWILNHYATTPDEPTTRSYDMGRQLVKDGHAITIFASSYSHYKFREKVLQPGEKWRAENHEGVRFIWLRTFPYRGNEWRRVINMLSYAWRAFRVGIRLKEKPDVIIGTCVHPLAVLTAYILSRFKKSRFFFEVTDLWPQTLVDMGALSEKNPMTLSLRALEKFLYRKAEKIIVLLPHADDYITSLGIPRDKIVWIPNGVDLSRYEGLKKYDGGKPGSFSIMYLGGHTLSNGLDIVLQAARILQDEGKSNIKFIFVGDGAEKPNLIGLSRELGLHNVEFRDQVPKSEIAKVMGDADAFISSARNVPGLHKYGISLNKLFDYLIAGRPVILAIDAGNNPVAEAGAGITVPPENSSALAQTAANLAAMKPEERLQMGENGIAYVKKHHDIRVLAKKLEELF